jgi:hypothetical protein
MARQMPGSIVNSLRVMWLMVAVAGLITVLIWWMRDEVLVAWAKGNPSAQEKLLSGGVEALRDDPIAPAFVPLAVTAFVGFVLLAIVVASFLAGGHPWARWVLTGNALTGVVVAAVCLAHDLPMVFVVLSILLLVLGVIQVFFLWRRDATAYLRD